MSLDELKRTNSRELEFKGTCSDVEKYKNGKTKVNLIIIAVIIVGIIIGFMVMK